MLPCTQIDENNVIFLIILLDIQRRPYPYSTRMRHGSRSTLPGLESRATAQPQYRPGASRSHLQDSAFSHFAVDSALASTVSHLTEPGSRSLTADLNAATVHEIAVAGRAQQMVTLDRSVCM